MPGNLSAAPDMTLASMLFLRFFAYLAVLVPTLAAHVQSLTGISLSAASPTFIELFALGQAFALTYLDLICSLHSFFPVNALCSISVSNCSPL